MIALPYSGTEVRSVEPPKSCGIFFLRHRRGKEGRFALIRDASPDKQCPIALYRQFLSNVGNIAERLGIIASFKASSMNRNTIAIAGHSVFRLEVELMSCNGSVMPID